MQLNSEETRLILVALHTLECATQDDIAKLSGCENLLIHPAFVAFGQYRQIVRLHTHLNSQAVDLHPSDRATAMRALGRYADVLAEHAEADDVGSDDFSSAERSSRERQLKATARLLARLTQGRPTQRRLAAVAVRSAI